MPDLADNTALRRFEMERSGGLAFVTYRIDADRLVLVHTEVPQTLAGRGFGSAIVRAVLEHARNRGLRVIPECDFIAGFIRRHPEYAALVSRP